MQNSLAFSNLDIGLQDCQGNDQELLGVGINLGPRKMQKVPQPVPGAALYLDVALKEKILNPGLTF